MTCLNECCAGVELDRLAGAHVQEVMRARAQLCAFGRAIRRGVLMTLTSPTTQGYVTTELNVLTGRVASTWN